MRKQHFSKSGEIRLWEGNSRRWACCSVTGMLPTQLFKCLRLPCAVPVTCLMKKKLLVGWRIRAFVGAQIFQWLPEKPNRHCQCFCKESRRCLGCRLAVVRASSGVMIALPWLGCPVLTLPSGGEFAKMGCSRCYSLILSSLALPIWQYPWMFYYFCLVLRKSKGKKNYLVWKVVCTENKVI